MQANGIILETPRMYIRKFDTRDLTDLFQICSNATLMRFVGDGKPLSMDQVQEWLTVTENNYVTKGFGNYALIHKAEQKLIGYCGLVYSKDIDNIELIYALSEAYWNLGLATEAGARMTDFGLNTVGLAEIFASIDPENTPSERILIKLGFQFAFKQNDEFGYNTSYYRITRDDVDNSAESR